jgi:hypothetical protein
MRALSKIILGIEAIICAYPTLLGAMLSLGAIAPFISGSYSSDATFNFLVGLVILSALISGWRILLWVITDGPRLGEKINFVWWVFSYTGIFCTILALLFTWLEARELYTLSRPNPVEVFLWGVYFFIPYTHIMLEIVWQKGANKSLQATPKSGAPEL